MHRNQYVGDVQALADGRAKVWLYSRIAVGDQLEIMHSSGNPKAKLERMRAQDDDAVAVAPGSGHLVKISLEVRV